MLENEIVNLHIESFSNLGYGIARQDGKVVFVANACPEDEVEAKVDKVCKNFTYATAVNVLKSSPHRTEPICPLQKVCGSCQLGFINYDYQLELKRQNVEDAMRKIGNLDVEVLAPIPSPQTLNYRHKIQYPIGETKNSKRILAGYYKQKSHEIVNIKYCPVQPTICDEIIEFVRNKAFDYGITGFNEKKHSGDLRHIVLRVSADNGKILVTLVVNATKQFKRLKDFAQCIFDEFELVTGVCANYNPKKTNVILGDKNILLSGEKRLEEIFETSKNHMISGEDAFKLYDTYGYPIELTEECASERGFIVDNEGFQRHMDMQKEQARSVSFDNRDQAKDYYDHTIWRLLR